MYLNDNQRTKFYESLGMNTRHFNQHVIRETNNSTERVFSQVRCDATPALPKPRCQALVLQHSRLCIHFRLFLMWAGRARMMACKGVVGADRLFVFHCPLDCRCQTLTTRPSGHAWTGWWSSTPRSARWRRACRGSACRWPRRHCSCRWSSSWHRCVCLFRYQCCSLAVHVGNY